MEMSYRSLCFYHDYAMLLSKDRVLNDSDSDSLRNEHQMRKTSISSKWVSDIIPVPWLLNCHFLSSNIDVGNVIEYRLNSHLNEYDNDSCIQQATVTGIRLEMDRKKITVLLNNRDHLQNSLHMVQRISMQNLYKYRRDHVESSP